ncbi:ubiquitin-related domain-containing protein, partial [Blyttiomyces helicus]
LTLNIGTLTGKTFPVQVMSSDTVGEVKWRIYEEEGIPVEAQILVFREKALVDDEATVGECGIRMGCTLQLVLQMMGG